MSSRKRIVPLAMKAMAATRPGSRMRRKRAISKPQTASAAAALAFCGALFALLRRIREPGRAAATAFIASGTILFLLDMLRVPEQPLSHNLLDVSQWIALAAVVFGACLLAFIPRARQQEAR